MTDNSDRTGRPAPRDHLAGGGDPPVDGAPNHDHGGPPEDDRRVSRRRVVQASAAVAGVGLAGCLGGGGGAPEPIALTSEQQCDVCGMVIEKHPGPDGQVFFAEHSPEDHDNPARFDSLKQCLFPYLWEKEAVDWTAEAVYVTDYSGVDYDVNTGGDAPLISSHPEAEAFARAQNLHYAVETDVQGAMGPDFVPFSDVDDAEAFAEEWNGRVVAYDGIDEGLVGG